MISNLKKVEKISPARKAVISKDWIETAAYFRWENRGRLHGNHHDDWLNAEKVVFEQLGVAGPLGSDPQPSPVEKRGPKLSSYA